MNLSSRGRGWLSRVAVAGVTIARVAAATSEQHVDIAYSPLDLMSLSSTGAPVQDLSVSLVAIEPLVVEIGLFGNRIPISAYQNVAYVYGFRAAIGARHQLWRRDFQQEGRLLLHIRELVGYEKLIEWGGCRGMECSEIAPFEGNALTGRLAAELGDWPLAAIGVGLRLEFGILFFPGRSSYPLHTVPSSALDAFAADGRLSLTVAF